MLHRCATATRTRPSGWETLSSRPIRVLMRSIVPCGSYSSQATGRSDPCSQRDCLPTFRLGHWLCPGRARPRSHRTGSSSCGPSRLRSCASTVAFTCPGIDRSNPSDERTVIQHGDFGPNNLLLADRGKVVVAVLDCEFSRPGPPIADTAWCEWIVRMHHPGAV